MDNAGTNTKPRVLIASALILLAAIFALSAGTASSQEKSTPEPEITSPVLTSIPLSPIDQAEKDGTADHLSLKDVTKMALQNNLDIAISDTNEEMNQNKILQDHGAYDPSLTITLGARSTTQPNTNLASASSTGLSNNTKLDTYNLQFNQNIPTGASIVASLNGNRSDTNQSFALFTPQYNSTSSIQLTQPLLRNRATDQSRSTIKIANLDLKISDSQFRQTITNTIATIQGSYWDLVSAIRDYAIKRDSVKLAQITVDQNREKVRVGTLSQLEVTVAQAALASQVVNLIASVQNINIAENNLRSTISSDHKSEIWQMVIVPKDSAEFAAYKMDLQSALDAALKNRPELEQYDLQMGETAINYNLDKNLTKWQLDAVGSFGTVGVAGPQSISSLTGQPTIPSSMVGGFGTAYGSLFTQGFKNWFVGFNIGIPLRNRSLEGQLGQLQVQKKQLLLNRKSQEQKIAVQIRNAVDDLNTKQQTVEAAKVARQLAKIQLDGETKRFNAGTSQNFLLLQRQNDLLTAQETELQALVAYKKAVITLQQDMFTLLETNDFEIAGANSGKGLK